VRIGGVELAQVNVAVGRGRLDSGVMAGFVARLEAVDAEARRAAGFVWRPTPDEVDWSEVAIFGDPMVVVVNLSVWASVEALRAYTFAGEHVAAMRRRAEWFRRPEEASLALWWVPDGHRPTFTEAWHRLAGMRRDGPGPEAFDLRRCFTPDGVPAGPRRG
jgi:heme-degrading monooxygenase HmoA